MPQLVRYALFAAVAIAAAGAGRADADDIYKCVDASGRVTYQNAPCAGGRAIDIAPGNFDPDSVQRLRAEQDAFNARQDIRREADARRAAANADAARARQREAEADARRAEQEAASGSCTTCFDNSSFIWAAPPWIGPVPPRPSPPRPPGPRPPAPRPPSYIVVR